MMKKKDQNAVIILIVIVVLAGFALRFLGDRIVLPWSRDNAIGIDVTFEYDDDGDGIADGIDSIDVEELGVLSFRPLSIIDPFGRSVLSAEFKLKGKVDWDGTLKNYNWDGWLRVYRDSVKVDEVRVTNPASIAKGSYNQLATTGKVSKSQLEAWANSYGTHTFKIEGEAQITIEFVEGNTERKDGTASALWKIDYVPDEPTAPALGSITTFSLTTYVSPIT